MDQLNRITYMERLLDELDAALDTLTAPEQYAAISHKMEELEAYYTGPLWRADLDDDNAGKLPADLKRGVLSEDAVYNLLLKRAEILNSF